MDGRTDGRTDKQAYRDARTHLKSKASGKRGKQSLRKEIKAKPREREERQGRKEPRIKKTTEVWWKKNLWRQ